jgi:carboxypeptidase C (cathepsin A)
MTEAKNFAKQLHPLREKTRDEENGLVGRRLKLENTTAEVMSKYIGIDADKIMYASGNPLEDGYLEKLIPGCRLGWLDGRMKAINTGVAADIPLHGGANEPSSSVIEGIYIAQWNEYLREELKYTSKSSFVGVSDRAFNDWDFSHIDAKGRKTSSLFDLYTANDLAATMSRNTDLRVLVADGYYDSQAPFFQTELTLEGMGLDESLRRNIAIKQYPAGNMVYLDDKSRSAMKTDLASFYDTLYRQPTPRHTPTRSTSSSGPVMPVGKGLRLTVDVDLANSYASEELSDRTAVNSGGWEKWETEFKNGDESMIVPGDPRGRRSGIDVLR